MRRYTDGEIVREGPAGEATASGPYSTGVGRPVMSPWPFGFPFVLTWDMQRGGQGNIGPGTIQSAHHDSQDVIPEAAMHSISNDRSYHVGVRHTLVSFSFSFSYSHLDGVAR